MGEGRGKKGDGVEGESVKICLNVRFKARGEIPLTPPKAESKKFLFQPPFQNNNYR